MTPAMNFAREQKVVLEIVVDDDCSTDGTRDILN